MDNNFPLFIYLKKWVFILKKPKKLIKFLKMSCFLVWFTFLSDYLHRLHIQILLTQANHVSIWANAYLPPPTPLRHEPGPEWRQIREGYVRTRQWLRCWHWYEMINDFFSACVTTTVGRYITTYWKLFDTKRSVRKNDTNIHEKFTQWYIGTKSVLHVKFFLYIYTKLSKLNFRIYFHHC